MGRFRVALVASVVALAGCTWTQTGGNAARTGSSPLESSWTTATAPSAAVKWRVGTAGRPILIGDDFVYAAYPGQVGAWPVTGGACAGLTTTACGPVWIAQAFGSVQNIAIGDRWLFVTAVTGGRWKLLAFDKTGAGPCNGPAPRTCVAVWTSDLGPFGSQAPGIMAVTATSVLLATPALGSRQIRGFDVRGVSNCSGSPAICSPTLRFEASETPLQAVAADATRLYSPGATGIDVFDLTKPSCATGTCRPIAHFDVPSPTTPAVAEGSVLTSSTASLLAFDVSLRVGCTATPAVHFAPKWRGAMSNDGAQLKVLVGSRAFVNVGNRVEVFDTATSGGCLNGICNPVWRTPENPEDGSLAMAATAKLLAVASMSRGPRQLGYSVDLDFFDLDGTACGGVPVVCPSTAHLHIADEPQGRMDDVAVGRGLIIIDMYDGATPWVVGLP